MPKPPITGERRPDQQLWEDGGRHDYGPCDVGYHRTGGVMVMFWRHPGSWVMTRRVGLDWDLSTDGQAMIPDKHEA